MFWDWWSIGVLKRIQLMVIILSFVSNFCHLNSIRICVPICWWITYVYGNLILADLRELLNLLNFRKHIVHLILHVIVEAYDPLDRNGNLMIKWEIKSLMSDGYEYYNLFWVIMNGKRLFKAISNPWDVKILKTRAF